jgi:hypothetical protein
MKLTKNTIYSKVLYCSLVGVVALLIFLVGIGVISFVVSWVFRVYEWTESIRKLPPLQYLGLAGLLMFLIANYSLYLGEVLVETKWKSIVDRFTVQKAVIVSVLSIVFCLSLSYFGFSWYVYQIYKLFWI